MSIFVYARDSVFAAKVSGPPAGPALAWTHGRPQGTPGLRHPRTALRVDIIRLAGMAIGGSDRGGRCAGGSRRRPERLAGKLECGCECDRDGATISTVAVLLMTCPSAAVAGDYWRVGLRSALLFIAAAVLYVPPVWLFERQRERRRIRRSSQVRTSSVRTDSFPYSGGEGTASGSSPRSAAVLTAAGVTVAETPGRRISADMAAPAA